MKHHQLFLLTFWLHHVYLARGATWEIDLSPLKEYLNSFNIIPSPYYRKEDVADIHSALNKRIPDEIRIIEILARLKSNDRQLLTREYQRAYETNLMRDLKNKLTGKLEEVVVAIMTPYDQFLTQEIYNAINGFRSDETGLTDTLCFLNTTMLDKIKEMYRILNGNDIEYEIKINTVGNFRKLMIACSQNMRFNKISTDDYNYKIHFGLTNDDLINYFTQTSFNELHDFEINRKSVFGKKLVDVVEEQPNGDFKRALVAILNYALSEELFFVKRFHESLNRQVVDHRSLIRLILMDKNFGYDKIRETYLRKFRTNIDDILTKKLPPGNYRKLIQALFIRM